MKFRLPILPFIVAALGGLCAALLGLFAAAAFPHGRVGPWLLLWLGLVALISAGLWVSVLRPLRRIQAYIRQTAAGDLDARLELRSRLSEIESLGDSVRAMVRQLAERFASLQASERRLREQQKLESLGRLAGGVAHDFNNVLQLVVSSASLAERELPPGHPARAELNLIRETGAHASSLVRQLLAYAGKQRVEPRVLEPAQAAREMSGLLRRLLGETVQLELRPGGEGLAALIDPGQFQELLINLCINARDAMPRGGHIRIETHAAGLSDADARAQPGARAGDYVVLSVSDDGKGMNAEVQARIFEPFFTTKGPGQGTGLGLATCFGVAAQAGGFLTVSSAPEQGSCFRLWLPLLPEHARPAPASVPPPPPALPPPPARPLRILLAEDQDDIRKTLAEFLRLEGHEVLAVADAAAGLALAARQSVDLVITDMVMPNMHGGAFVAELRQRQPGLPCIFMTGYDQASAGHGLALGSRDCYLQKPFSLEVLESAIAGLLNSPPRSNA